MMEKIKTKVFRQNNNKKLEQVINNFLDTDVEFIKVKYSTHVHLNEEIFTALIMYRALD